jgi:CxxC motif-containing protein (DUF1111 family)
MINFRLSGTTSERHSASSIDRSRNPLTFPCSLGESSRFNRSKEVVVKLRVVALLSVSLLVFAFPLFSQVDPGLRPTPANVGNPLPSVLQNNPPTIYDFFKDGAARFQEVDSVSGNLPNEIGVGLGPRFNSRGCALCHAFPAVGGASPRQNPQVTDATADGALNVIPPFIKPDGPVLEARFPFFTDSAGNPIPSQPNGGVEDLFTIAGRVDSVNCGPNQIQQPNFQSAIDHNNIVFRIPIQTFGDGLIENVDETDLLAYQASVAGNPFGIAGTFNHNGNDGTIARFGWKAQNKSLQIFSGEAYNVEQGVSNELFTNERPLPEEDRAKGLPEPCKINPTPEDHTNFNVSSVKTPSDAVQFSTFMRLLAPIDRSFTTPGGQDSIANGQNLFVTIGCETCHHKAFTTRPSAITPSLGNANVPLWSDLEIHRMGVKLADNISQGTAGGNQFRTQPLWGLGLRIFLLHDGRTTNLLDAIAFHQSDGSEANTSVINFNNLTVQQKQDVLNFLRSL